MTERIRLFLIAAAFLCAMPASAAARAVWIWEEDSYAILENATFRREAIAFLRREHVTTLYLYADTYKDRTLIESDPEAYRRALTQLHRKGFRVYALLGSAYLRTEEYVLPEHRAEAMRMFDRVLKYNGSSSREARFDGISLDIEPHILDAWSSRRDELLSGFLDLSRVLMQAKRRSEQDLLVGCAMPFWWDNIGIVWNGVTKKMSDHVLDIFDYAALMDYRDHASGHDGIIDHALNEIDYASRAKKKIVIGVDVTPSELKKLSFDHLKKADLERELALTEKAFQGSPAFAGFAIHHFRAYQRWLGRQVRP